jgi:hypothetical protein
MVEAHSKTPFILQLVIENYLHTPIFASDKCYDNFDNDFHFECILLVIVIVNYNTNIDAILTLTYNKKHLKQTTQF